VLVWLYNFQASRFRREAKAKIHFIQEHYMSAPSRRPEIRRRRTRKEKIVQLRKRLTAAKTDADRSRLTAKLHKLAILSPGQPLVK
jgi:hypothetical protein